MKKKSSSKNSFLSDVQAENFYFQVKFINCYLREIISFTKKMTLETGASLIRAPTCDFQQCVFLTSVDSEEPMQPPVKLRNSK